MKKNSKPPNEYLIDLLKSRFLIILSILYCLGATLEKYGQNDDVFLVFRKKKKKKKKERKKEEEEAF